MHRSLAASIIALTLGSYALAQGDAYTLTESFGKDAQHHVRCAVDIKGYLVVPGKDNKATNLPITGKSNIIYDERILVVNADRRIERTIRSYKALDFERVVGQQNQQSKLRPEAMKLVIMRHNQYELPFSPTIPLTWGEIELVRTDVFVPALAGLLPTAPKRIGETWNADVVAVQELTDLDKVDKSDFVCKLHDVVKANDRPTARISFKGNVEGWGEDGKAKHAMEGWVLVDLQARFMTLIQVSATHWMLDKDGREYGQISGTLKINRFAAQTSDLNNLAGVKTEPTAENMMLVFEHPQIGARFLYPRNWRVGVFNDKQISIDERRGHGMLITLGAASATPRGDKFFKDTKEWLAKQKITVRTENPPRTIQGDMEGFSFETQSEKKESILLQYYRMHQGNNGATIAGRYTEKDRAAVHTEAERILRTLQLTAK